MKLADFDYYLPKSLIAKYPAKERGESRLLVVDRVSKKISHQFFKDIIQYFNKGDLLVLNNTRVTPVRLFGKKLTGGKAEALILNNQGEFGKLSEYEALLKPARGMKLGAKLIFADGKIEAAITRIESGKKYLKFETDRDLLDLLHEIGQMPLPPYIKRSVESLDKDRYQTVYASREGAVASPTAGLHFTKDILKSIVSKGINVEELTLHVGYGTFKSVKEIDISKHIMEEEYFEIKKTLVDRLKNRHGKAIVVGTTSCRALETLVINRNLDCIDGIYRGWTNIFLYPPYKFKNVDTLLTNFHLPKTTLLMLVSAFCGRELLFKAYEEAIKEKYRFYSYGDCMLII